VSPTGPTTEICDNGADDDCDGHTDCGDDDDCDGQPAPPTQWGESSCRCRASLPSVCDQAVPCGDCYYVKGDHYWCRKVNGVWMWTVAFDPTSANLCGDSHCTIACCEHTDVWCNNGKWEAGLPTADCLEPPHSHSCL
jgi:hypothetical protein